MKTNEQTGYLTFNTDEIDKNTLYICKSWIYDIYKRYKLTETAKSKAQTERNQQLNAGLKLAFDMLETLEKHASDENKTLDCWKA